MRAGQYRNEIGKTIELLYRIADRIDGDEYLRNNCIDLFGLGCGAMSSQLRTGIQAIVEMRSQLESERANRGFAEIAERDLRDRCEKVFGDREVDTYPDRYLNAIKELVARLDSEVKE